MEPASAFGTNPRTTDASRTEQSIGSRTASGTLLSAIWAVESARTAPPIELSGRTVTNI
jgi:acyl dehydratase